MLMYLSICVVISLLLHALVKRFAGASLVAFVACLALPHIVATIKTGEGRDLLPGLASIVFATQYALPVIIATGVPFLIVRHQRRRRQEKVSR
jgi:hypothetical protein